MMIGHKTRLPYAQDLQSGRRILVDTGAEVNVFPATRMDRNSHFQRTKLTAANVSNICTYGERTISLIFSKRHFRWTFTIAQVSQPLLGADFLMAHSLLVDIKGQRLVDPFEFTSLTLRSITAVAPHLGSIASADDAFAKLLADFPDVTMTSFSNPSPTHRMELFIPTNGPPHHARARRLLPDKLQLAKDKFRIMEELGIIRRSK